MRYMLTSNEEQIAKEWGKYQGYTVRPLPSTIAYYRHWIARKTLQQKYLIFGGTPEIRSLFQALALKVVLLDKNIEIVRAMGRLTLANIPIEKNETLIKKNWLEANSLPQKFDLLIGDDAINMVSWNDFSLFLKTAYQLLNEDGIFICHLLVKPAEKLINNRIDDLLVEYQRGDIPSVYDLASRLNFICFDKKQYSMGWQQTIEALGKEKLDLFKPDLDFIDTFKFCNSLFYCPPQQQFEEKTHQYFEIVELFYPHEHHYCQYEPVYILKKKAHAND